MTIAGLSLSTGRGRWVAPALAWLALAPAQASALDPFALAAKLARPAPASIRFVEARYSSLLATPLTVSGQLGYLGAGALERRVERPFRELTTIRGEDVAVQREGEHTVRFSLKRAPELRGMLSSFNALLAGDRALLERTFTLSAEGNEANWRLTLTPLGPRMRERISQVKVDGSGDALRCLTLAEPDGDASIMLLGDAVPASLPEPLQRVWLEALCAGEEPGQ